MSVVAVIPTRLASTRFPRKALADRTGYPLVVHACMQAAKARTVDRVLVAADGDEIKAAVEAHGFECTLTDPDHPNGTSRINEALQDVHCEYVVNVQGDEPELDPSDIDASIDVLIGHADCKVATLATPFAPEDDRSDSNLVKIYHDNGIAIDFSRGLKGSADPMRHVGLYAYRRDFLPVYVGLPETDRERAERLEQLRIMDHGHSMAVAVVPVARHGIDTPEQYREFVSRWRSTGQE